MDVNLPTRGPILQLAIPARSWCAHIQCAMQNGLPVFLARALAPVTLLLASATLFAQNLPPAQPTQTLSTPTPQPLLRAAPHHMQILYNSGVLSIHAENSSLNGILREISRVTGMSVTGGVLEERVYGNYGPADTGTVLATLLAGTGSNMLLEESTLDRPLTLVLTPRGGGPTPPSPANTASDPDDAREQADLPPQQVRPAPRQNPAPPSVPTLAPVSPPAVSNTLTDSSSPTSAPTGTTDQQSPNGVKTPQQIYDQLMKLKQQQPAAAPQ